jgi:polysaccharide pyruvyl transferase WcaK-like protein
VIRPRVLVAVWHGTDDETDHEALGHIVGRLRELRPDVELVAAGPDPIEITVRHGIAGVSSADPVAVDAVLDGASALVVGGGPPWDDTELVALGGLAGLFWGAAPGRVPARWSTGPPAVLTLALLAVLRGVPLHLHSIRLGDLDDQGGQRLIAFLARECASLTVGDRVSGERLAALGRTGVRVAPVGEDLEDVTALVHAEGSAPVLPPGRLRLRRQT